MNIPQLLKNWKNKNKGPIETQIFNLVWGIRGFFIVVWKIIKSIALLLAGIYCWIAEIRATPKLKPWITFSIELVVFFALAMIPVFHLYVENVRLRDKHSVQSFKAEEKYKQELIKAEMEFYSQGVKDVRDSIAKEKIKKD